jgi:hypothetical protein
MNNDPLSPLGQMIAGIAESHAIGVRSGALSERLNITPAIHALEREFFAALIDPETKMKTSLQVAICAVIALVPSAITDKVNAYANAKIKEDQLSRHQGRPEHDTDVVGRALKAGM